MRILIKAAASEDGSDAGNVCLLADDDRSVKDLKWYTVLSKKYHDKIQAFAPDCSTMFSGTILEEICDSTENMR